MAEKTTLPAGRNGYNFDTYDDPGERAETFLLWKLIIWIFAKFMNIQLAEGGFCSTYREWHLLWEGIWAGIKAPQLADIPECPPLWMDEALYYRGGAIVANVAKIYGTAGAAALLGVWLNNSGSIAAALKTILLLLAGIA